VLPIGIPSVALTGGMTTVVAPPWPSLDGPISVGTESLDSALVEVESVGSGPVDVTEPPMATSLGRTSVGPTTPDVASAPGSNDAVALSWTSGAEVTVVSSTSSVSVLPGAVLTSPEDAAGPESAASELDPVVGASEPGIRVFGSETSSPGRLLWVGTPPLLSDASAEVLCGRSVVVSDAAVADVDVDNAKSGPGLDSILISTQRPFWHSLPCSQSVLDAHLGWRTHAPAWQIRVPSQSEFAVQGDAMEQRPSRHSYPAAHSRVDWHGVRGTQAPDRHCEAWPQSSSCTQRLLGIQEPLSQT
jgi:hypothetical protein